MGIMRSGHGLVWVNFHSEYLFSGFTLLLWGFDVLAFLWAKLLHC